VRRIHASFLWFPIGDRLIPRGGIAPGYGEGIEDVSNEDQDRRASNFAKPAKRGRKMKNRLLAFGLVAVLTWGMDLQVLAEEFTPKDQVSEEELLFMEIPQVFASSKRLQPITEAASSMEIITAEDIKQSGATNVADVLRSVSGVDVRESDVAQHVIGVRGFCDTGHLLVTLDGNNVFMYHANHIFLDWAPVDLEEIDHIEIIKGPGAIFYGGNAFSGVINIITKTPQQLKGAQVNMVGGNWGTLRGNVVCAGSNGSLDYSISGGYRRAEEWEEPRLKGIEGENFRVGYFAGKAIYNLNEKSSLSLMARYSDAKNVISTVCNPKTTFIAARYDQPDFWLRLFYNNHEKTFWDHTYSVKDANYEFEFFRALRWGKNITSFGGFVKHTAWKVETLEETFATGPEIGSIEKHDVKDGALNVENECHINDQFILTLGARGEHYTHLDYLGLGRGSIIYKPAESQCLRFTVASGYYIPSLFQHTNEGTAYPFAVGNYSLEEEKILSYELSYYTQLTDRTKLKTAVFYNDYRDLIDNTQTGPTQNVADAYQKGGELDFDFILTGQLTGFANYAYQTIHRTDYGDLAVDPEHKCNLGLRAKLAKWSANATFHYVDEYYEIYLTSNPVFGCVETGPSKVPSYTTVDARVAYDPADNLELSVAAYNLFRNKHRESNEAGWHTGDLIDRKITASLGLRF
jgi:iron complex outermembrane receptor protein